MCLYMHIFCYHVISLVLGKSILTKYWFVTISFSFLCAHLITCVCFFALFSFCKTEPYAAVYFYSTDYIKEDIYVMHLNCEMTKVLTITLLPKTAAILYFYNSYFILFCQLGFCHPAVVLFDGNDMQRILVIFSFEQFPWEQLC